MPHSDPGALTLKEALALPPVAVGCPELLSGMLPLDHPVRWVHVIGEPHPGPMLQGGELILSTLPLLHEGRDDLSELLHGYLDDLDSVDAAGLAVEVLPDRPRLLASLRQVTAERTERRASHALTPVLRFPRVVRFVEITEHLHRELITRQLKAGRDSPGRDPLMEATSALFDDLAAARPPEEHEASSRARALGMPAATILVPLSCVIDGPGGTLHGTSQVVEELGAVVREVAAQMHLPVLVGTCRPDALAVLTSGHHGADPEDAARRLCRAVAAHPQGGLGGALPRHTVGIGTPTRTLREARGELDAAQEVAVAAASLQGLVRRDDRDAADPWSTEDIRLWGVLAELSDSTAPERFLAAELQLLRESAEDAPDLLCLVEALVRTRGSKAETARHLGISRPTLYARLEALERRLGRSLDDGETLTALHVAHMLEQLNRAE